MNIPQQRAEQRLHCELQERLNIFMQKLKVAVPAGYEIDVKIQLKSVRKAKPQTRPATVGEVLDEFSFFVCGFQTKDWRKAAAWLVKDKVDVPVLTFLGDNLEKDLLRTPNFGERGLKKIYTVLRWHGYHEHFAK